MVSLLLLLMSLAGFTSDDSVVYARYRSSEKNDRWEKPEGNRERIIMKDKRGGSDNCVDVWSRWTNDSLYVYFQVLDKDLRALQIEQDHPKLFLDDMVEVLIDPDNDRDTCWRADDIVYHVNLLGVKKDDRGTAECISDPKWDGAATFRMFMHGTLNDPTDVDIGYDVEIAISWQELGVAPFEGRKLSINFANGDNDGRGRQLFDWMAAWPLRSPYAYGNLILLK